MNKLFNGDLIAAHEDSIYGMAAKYKAPIYGDTDNANGTFSRSYFLNGTYGGEGSAFHISRDNSAKIYLSSINGVTKDLNIYLRMTNIAWFNGDGPRLNDSAFIEAKVTGTSAAGTHEYKKILATDGAINPDFNISDQDSIVPLYWISGAPDHNYMTQSRLINLIAGSAILNDTSAELTLKPVGCDIDIALEPIGSVSQVTSPWTTIKSVGYYGDATRTLTAKIDRQSGTVYDLYDFVVYKHN
jgi:hypothetical protein